MGNIFSQTDQNDPNSQSSTSIKRQIPNSAGAAGLKQTIAQNMRLSKGKLISLLKANHMNYSIVHRNLFYNTLPHVSPVLRFRLTIAFGSCVFVWVCASTIV